MNNNTSFFSQNSNDKHDDSNSYEPENPTNDQHDNSDQTTSENIKADEPSAKPAKKKLTTTEKQILDTQERLKKLKEKSKEQKRKAKQKNEADILKILRSEGLLKVSISEWEAKSSEVAKIFK